MKTQYLGDAKDSFKWDYHSHLTSSISAELLVVPMMTKSDKTKQGNLPPEKFPADNEIISFCHKLRNYRDVRLLEEIPGKNGNLLKIEIAHPTHFFRHDNRDNYFRAITFGSNQVIFLDPDNGFEPEKSCGAQHISFNEIHHIAKNMDNRSVISVFHHFRRVSFPEDYTNIVKKLNGLHYTALYWNPHLMFVQIAKERSVIDRVIESNVQYLNPIKPVKML